MCQGQALTLRDMKPREFNPLKMDVQAFAHNGERASGQWPLSQLPRLAAGALVLADSLPMVAWQAQGEERKVGGAMQTWLRVEAQVTLGMTCQRCLAPVQETVTLDRWLRFVESEDQAAELDAELEDDVLATSKIFDLRWLIEDELILALPLVPKHRNCKPAAGAQDPEDEVVAPQQVAPESTESRGEPRQRPFAGLGDLLKRSSGSGSST